MRVELINNQADSVLHTLAERMADAETRRLSPLKKAKRAYECLRHGSPNTAQAALDAFKTLIDLRNEIIHYKPIAGSDRTVLAANAYVQFFASLGLVPSAAQGYGGDLTWDRVVLVPVVARWAYNTALRTIQVIAGALPSSLARTEVTRVWCESLPTLFAGV
jgi:hypothetical protein